MFAMEKRTSINYTAINFRVMYMLNENIFVLFISQLVKAETKFPSAPVELPYKTNDRPLTNESARSISVIL